MTKNKEMTWPVVDWTVVGFRSLAVGVGLVGMAFALFFLWGGVSTLLLMVQSFGYLIGALLLLGLGVLVVVFFSWVVVKIWKGDVFD